LPKYLWPEMKVRQYQLYYDQRLTLVASFIRTFLLVPGIQFRCLQDTYPQVDDNKIFDSEAKFFVIDSTGAAHINYDGIKYLVVRSPIFRYLGYILKFNFAAKLFNIYLDSSLRAQLSDIEAPFPTQATFSSKVGGKKLQKLRRLIFYTILPTICIMFVFVYNCHTLSDYRLIPYNVAVLGDAFGLDQMWNMFSPPPEDGYFHILQGSLQNGSEIELLRNFGLRNFEPTTFTVEAPDQRTIYMNHRWYKLFESYVYHEAMDSIKLETGRYICREYNTKHEDNPLLNWDMHQCTSISKWEPYGEKTNFECRVVWEHSCF